MSKKKFIRQCPHCKSKKGYKLSIIIEYNVEYHNYYGEKFLINGMEGINVVECDDIHPVVRCIDCNNSCSYNLVEKKIK